VRKHLLLAALFVGAALPGAYAPAACASEQHHAALVVDTGDATYSYCVALTDDSVSGLELIQLANEQHGLQYRLGDGGQAVCMLANVGAEGDDCFGEYPDFWGYWRGDGSSGWTWSSVGAGSTVVEEGDVEGWSWGRGQDGSTHPPPPTTRFEDVCEARSSSEAPTRKTPTRQKQQRQDESAASGEEQTRTSNRVVSTAVNERKAGHRSEEPSQESNDAKRRLTPRTATETEGTPAAVTDAAAQEPELDPGNLVPTLVAVLLVAALGIGGVIAMRRRKT
jgi:hypothetical protein